MRTCHLFIYVILVSLTACNPGGTSTKDDEGPLQLFLNVLHSGTVSEGGVSYYWVSGTSSGNQYTVTMSNVWSSVDLTVEFCTFTCNTTVCPSGKGGQCSTFIVSDGQDLLINVYGGGYQSLNSINPEIKVDKYFENIQKAGVIGGKYSLLVQ